MKESNVINLAKAIAAAVLLVPANAYPMGVGDLQLHSALNQKLQAEIRLHLAPGEDPSDINIRLAPPEKFDQAGVPWSYFLSKIHFDPVVINSSTVIVKVTSKEVLTEPFLNFLLEVNWPQGNVYREFTVLVDPPSEYDTPTAVASRPRPAPVASNDFEMPAPRPAVTRKARVSNRPTAASSSESRPAPAPVLTDGTYGPTRQADTLWNIASHLAAERNVSTNEMMQALYRANPEAFQGSMNALRVGATLKVPDASAMTARPAQKTASKPKALPKPEVSKALTIEPPTDGKSSGNATGKDSANDVNLNGNGSGNGTGDSKSLEMQSRLEKLEQQLTLMQKTLELRDQQLATLQNQTANKQPGTVSSQQPPVNTGTPTEQTPQQPESTSQTQSPVTQPATSTQQSQPPKPPVKITPPPRVEIAESEFDPSIALGTLGVGLLGVFGWLFWRKRKIERQTDSESMFAMASQVRAPNVNLAGNALVVPVVDVDTNGIYDANAMGESSFISDFAPSDFDSFDTDQNEIDPLSEADVYLAYGRYQQAEDLIRRAIIDQPARDDYKFKLLEILHSSDNQAGFEAYIQDLANSGKQSDVGFWNKVQDIAKELAPSFAIERIKPAISNIAATAIASSAASASIEAPANFSATSAFNEFDFSAADDINIPEDLPESNRDDDFLDPNSLIVPLEAGSLGELQSDLGDLQLNIPNDLMIGENALDFDLGSFVTETASKSPSVTPRDDHALDSSLSSLDSFSSLKLDESFFAPKNPGKSQKSSANKSLSEDSFTLNFDSEIVGFAPNPLDFPATRIADKSITSSSSKELPDFDAMSSAISQSSSGGKKDAGKISDEFDFNFDFDTAVSELRPDSLSEHNLGVSDLTDMDEFETKIDLAKAYIDMGDTETAKSIAEEVLQQGSSEQKRQAQALLDQLK